MATEEFLLKWNDHQSKIIDIFSELCTEELLVDVTLACEDRTFTAHKLILSACSPYFRKLFTMNPCKHPIVFLKDMKSNYVEALLKFMYKGEISINESDLMPLIQTAKSLQIKGLTDVASSTADEMRHKSSKSSTPPAEPSPLSKRRKTSDTVHGPELQISEITCQNIPNSGSSDVGSVEAVKDQPPLPCGENYGAVSQTDEASPAEYTDSVTHSYELDTKAENEYEGSEECLNVPVLGDMNVPSKARKVNNSQATAEFQVQRSSHTQVAVEYTEKRTSHLKSAAADYGAGSSVHGVGSSSQDVGSSVAYQKHGSNQGPYSYGVYSEEQVELQSIKTEAQDAWDVPDPDLSQLCEPTVVVSDRGPSISTEGQQLEISCDAKNVVGLSDVKCEYCQRVFTRKYDMTRHVNTVHLGQRNFICNICNRRFTHKQHMMSHVRTIHGRFREKKELLYSTKDDA